MLESTLFLELESNISRGNIILLFNSWGKLIKLIRLSLINLTFSVILSIIFIFPRFMHIKQDILVLNKILLSGFFIGNLISAFLSSYIVRLFRNYKVFLFINTTLFILLVPLFQYVTEEYFSLYALSLGLLGGGAPIIWIQIVTRSYGTNQRSTASNTMFAIGRVFAIMMNFLIVWWLQTPDLFIRNVLYFTYIVGFLVIISLIFTKNNYSRDICFTE
jgi:hypothetical protein